MAWLFKQTGSENWWLGYRANGKQFRRSTGTTDRVQAEKELAKVDTLFGHHRAGSLTEELYQVLTGRSLPNVTLKAALDDWLTECRGATSPGTVVRYELVAREFAEHMNATDLGPMLQAVNSENVRTCLTKKRAATSASNANLGRKVLSIFFRRALANEQIKVNPMLPVKPFKPGAAEKVSRRAYTVAELELIYSKAPNDFWRYMVLGELYTGLRMGDLICLHWPAVDWSSNMIRLRAGKTAKTLCVPIYPTFRRLLDNLAEKPARGVGDCIWPDEAARYEKSCSNTFSNAFYDEILTPAGLVPARQHKRATKSGRNGRRELHQVSFHSLRHSFVSFLKSSGSNQAIAKELAGHSSDQVSQLYTHIPEAVLADAIKQLPEITK